MEGLKSMTINERLNKLEKTSHTGYYKVTFKNSEYMCLSSFQLLIFSIHTSKNKCNDIKKVETLSKDTNKNFVNLCMAIMISYL